MWINTAYFQSMKYDGRHRAGWEELRRMARHALR
ncbi:hypothetical protein BDFG_04079 [Blastomyces dermatitidis ATCC 26199]|nr:hypothetical protein BDFG_04079 [Blastomyces dermatitidis ATCC 26199]